MDDDSEEEEDEIASLDEKGEVVYHALVKNNIACPNFGEILTFAMESKKIIEQLQDQDGEQEHTIENIQSLSNDLRKAYLEEQTTKESLEETFALELSRVKDNHDRELMVACSLKTKNDELVVAHAKLVEDFKHL